MNKCKVCKKQKGDTPRERCRSCAATKRNIEGKAGFQKGHPYVGTGPRGGYITKEGYRSICEKLEHRTVMEKYLGRKLTRDEFVHHKNGNKLDNRLSNLEVLDNSTHRKEHVKKQPRNKKGRFK